MIMTMPSPQLRVLRVPLPSLAHGGTQLATYIHFQKLHLKVESTYKDTISSVLLSHWYVLQRAWEAWVRYTAFRKRP